MLQFRWWIDWHNYWPESNKKIHVFFLQIGCKKSGKLQLSNEKFCDGKKRRFFLIISIKIIQTWHRNSNNTNLLSTG
jgi:hypothetical protein